MRRRAALSARRYAAHRLCRRRPGTGLGRDRDLPPGRRHQLRRLERRRAGTASISRVSTVAELAAEKGAYQILTPAEARRLTEAGFPLNLQPLVGGLPPDLAWPYLESAAALWAAG